MSFLADLFKHKGNDALVREQISFFIRDAQNRAVEAGKLIQEIQKAGHADISPLCSELVRLNADLGQTLEQVQCSLK